jgi:Uma2 family endonuclease
MATATPTKPSQKQAQRKEYVSYEAYLALAPDSRIVEWVDGEIIAYMPASLEHQLLVAFLSRLIGDFCEALGLGTVLAAPFEVKLWPGGPSREPDLLFISKARLAQLGSRRFEGAPDLVVEIVSPGSVREDKVRKFAEYEQAGVGEYWLIDPRPRQESAEFYRRDEAGIFQPLEIAEDGRVSSTVLPRFRLNVDWLRRDQQPPVHAALADIFAADETFPRELSELHRRLAAPFETGAA